MVYENCYAIHAICYKSVLDYSDVMIYCQLSTWWITLFLNKHNLLINQMCYLSQIWNNVVFRCKLLATRNECILTQYNEILTAMQSRNVKMLLFLLSQEKNCFAWVNSFYMNQIYKNSPKCTSLLFILIQQHFPWTWFSLENCK